MTVPPLTRHKRQRNGKIARLPEAIRERINVMIEDGVRYRDIIKALAQPGSPALPYPISEMNLSNWRKGGHQEWLRRQQQLELNRKLPLAYPETHPSVRNLLQLLKEQLSRREAPKIETGTRSEQI
jgi:hypothetical protein